MCVNTGGMSHKHLSHGGALLLFDDKEIKMAKMTGETQGKIRWGAPGRWKMKKKCKRKVKSCLMTR